MKKTIQFIFSLLISVVSLPCALSFSVRPRLVLALFSFIIIICTYKSIDGKDSFVADAASFAASFGMAAVSGHFMPFICIMTARSQKRRLLWVVIPAACYLPVGILLQRRSAPHTILYFLILLLICTLITAAEHFAELFLETKSRIKSASTASAINEMNEKKKSRQLSQQSYIAQKAARLEERENISRNIHNSVGHSITAAIMTLDAADMLFEVSPDKAREKLGAANERIRESLSSIRRAVRVLDNENKSVSLSDLSEMLRAICDSFVMDTRISLKQSYDGCDMNLNMPSEHTEFLCGALSELLTNGVRHGGADSFFVTLISDSRHLQLSVSDNGKSDFSEENGSRRIESGFGLKKLISYCRKCGGTAVFTNGNGFRSVISLPIPEEEENEQI